MTDQAAGQERPSENRIREALSLGSIDYFVVACPKDLTMYRDAVKTTGNEDKLKVMDIAEFVADAMAEWVLQLKPGGPVYVDYQLPEEAEGMGLSEAPRGALGHWITIKDKKIDHYQLVVPTTWNASPKDANGQPGPIEQAILDTKVKDPENPFEIVRIVRSFDPCLACAVHLIDARGDEIGRHRIV